MDAESEDWLRLLHATGGPRDDAIRRLHERLLRVAHHEVRRRQTPVSGVELDDIAAQAASDATLAVLAKLDTFRGESRFTTWAYKFVILEVSNKIGRHYWRKPQVALQPEDWDRLPERFGIDPSLHAEAAELMAAIQHAVETTLTERQRRLFIEIVVKGIPLDALVIKLGVNRNAIYKTIFEARRKIRGFLVANHYLTDHVAWDEP
ncbi:sigma-70 family RNA polymerase sigma factor [Mycobacterium sp. 21AC1]|uniref:sigma-70 family RNA polymerase sigma factor n=1 Tax=[Mycobacterium] appelbergii TaxID=2939269 RepID=UPI002938CF87|nr:sigma-70 family RNA polymerase sigma factor [Mycobacterium sp. 21AC1]MDV3127952.1 sigma-70 family RNA polymerase sigma factor [Mycobacterium sp. 21AC1]